MKLLIAALVIFSASAFAGKESCRLKEVRHVEDHGLAYVDVKYRSNANLDQCMEEARALLGNVVEGRYVYYRGSRQHRRRVVDEHAQFKTIKVVLKYDGPEGKFVMKFRQKR